MTKPLVPIIVNVKFQKHRKDVQTRQKELEKSKSMSKNNRPYEECTCRCKYRYTNAAFKPEESNLTPPATQDLREHTQLSPKELEQMDQVLAVAQKETGKFKYGALKRFNLGMSRNLNDLVVKDNRMKLQSSPRPDYTFNMRRGSILDDVEIEELTKHEILLLCRQSEISLHRQIQELLENQRRLRLELERYTTSTDYGEITGEVFYI